ncbi:hypothetical protein [Leeuwenhoekiella sp. H156]|uniref:hypothetical protein n=1 Tax=Leeuwenhoekiella sp. H156 TaxID=3450128 RepID=UPI003FA409A2
MKFILLTFLLLTSLIAQSQSTPMSGNSFHLYGPNSTWNAYLRVGGNGNDPNVASVVATNGNLHLDSRTGYHTYLNYYSEGNTYINAKGGKVGIGTSNPLDKLHINGNIRLQGSGNIIYWDWPGRGIEQFSSGGINRMIRFKNSMGSSNPDGGFSFTDDSGLSVLRIKDYKVGIGTTSPDEKLTVKGKIHSEEVRVDLSVPAPDYVFENSYQLPSLEELEKYIRNNKHLPEVPSADEFQKDGISVGTMNMLLLKKIEELTLYIINQSEKIKSLELDNKEIKKILMTH